MKRFFNNTIIRQTRNLLAAAVAFLSLTSEAAEMTLSWDGSETAQGYYIYYGEKGGEARKINAGCDAQFTVTNLEEGKTYFFYATAYNETGLESEPSNEVLFNIPSENLRLAKKSYELLSNAKSSTSGLVFAFAALMARPFGFTRLMRFSPAQAKR